MQSSKSQTVLLNLSANKIAAIVAWLIGVFTTHLFIGAITVTPVVISVLIAGLLQWLLTMIERPLWKWTMKRSGGKFVLLAAIMTIVDGIINAAGIYPHMAKLAETNVAEMLADVLNVQNAMSKPSTFLIALAIGLGFAAVPELLWEQS